MRKRICRFAAMRRTKFRRSDGLSLAQLPLPAGINDSINFINKLRQVCESVSAVLRVEKANLFENSENIADSVLCADRELIIS